MATSAKEEIRVMLIGERGVGKSTIANKLFDLHGKGEERFRVRGDPAAATVSGSQYLRKDECTFSAEPSITSRRVHVVEVRGVLGKDVTSPRKIWTDIITAFEFLKKEVNVFLLVLNVNNPENSEVVTRALLEFFGAEAGLHTMVLFTHNDKPDETMANRVAMYHHGNYLRQLLRQDFPYKVLPMNNGGEFPRFEILRQISVFQSNVPAYDLRLFKKAQMEYLQNWAGEMRSRENGIIKVKIEGRYQIIGVPDVLLLFDRYYTEQELDEVFPQ